MKRIISLLIVLTIMMFTGVTIQAESGGYWIEDIVAPEMKAIFENEGGMVSFTAPDGKNRFLNENYEAVLPGIYSAESERSLYSLYSFYPSYSLDSLDDGYAIACIYDEQGEKQYGVIDREWQVVVPFEYSANIKMLGSDLFGVRKDGASGVIDKFGNMILPCKYSGINCCGDFLVADVDIWNSGMFDLKGNQILPCEYSISYTKYDVNTGLIPIRKQDESGSYTYGYADKTGIVIPLTYSFADGFSDGLAYIRDVDGNQAYIDTSGNVVISLANDLGPSPFLDGFSKVRKSDNKVGVIDRTGAVVIPFYDNIGVYNDYDLSDLRQYGLTAVRDDGKWGLINSNGELIFDFIFTSLTRFRGGYAFFTETDQDGNMTMGIMNQYGEITARGLPPFETRYELMTGVSMTGEKPQSYTTYFSDGLMSVSVDGKWGAINSFGEVVVDMLYDYCFYYQDGYAIVTKDGGHGKQNILDRQGNLILDKWYDCVNLDEPYYICQNKTGESEIRDLDMNIVASGESWTLTDGLDTSISVEYDGYYGIGINMQYDDKHVSIEHFKDNIFTYRKLGGTLGLFAIHKIPDEITVTVNGEALEFDQQPIMDSDRVLVPMRKIFETLGAKVEWNGDTQTITSIKDDIVIIMQIGNNTITVNDGEFTLDVPPQIMSDRTLVPIRAVAESFRINVEWDEKKRTVVLCT